LSCVSSNTGISGAYFFQNSQDISLIVEGRYTIINRIRCLRHRSTGCRRKPQVGTWGGALASIISELIRKKQRNLTRGLSLFFVAGDLVFAAARLVGALSVLNNSRTRFACAAVNPNDASRP
jgi:hypothetical protein